MLFEKSFFHYFRLFTFFVYITFMYLWLTYLSMLGESVFFSMLQKYYLWCSCW